MVHTVAGPFSKFTPSMPKRSDTDEGSYLFEVRPKFWEAKPIPNEKFVSAKSIEDRSINLYCSLECDGYDLGASGPAGYDGPGQTQTVEVLRSPGSTPMAV